VASHNPASLNRVGFAVISIGVAHTKCHFELLDEAELLLTYALVPVDIVETRIALINGLTAAEHK